MDDFFLLFSTDLLNMKSALKKIGNRHFRCKIVWTFDLRCQNFEKMHINYIFCNGVNISACELISKRICRWTAQQNSSASTCACRPLALIPFAASRRRSPSAAVSSGRTYRRCNTRLRRRAFLSLWACFPAAQYCASTEYLRPQRPAVLAIPRHRCREWIGWAREITTGRKLCTVEFIRLFG